MPVIDTANHIQVMRRAIAASEALGLPVHPDHHFGYVIKAEDRMFYVAISDSGYVVDGPLCKAVEGRTLKEAFRKRIEEMERHIKHANEVRDELANVVDKLPGV
jgi:hypothetical protein